MAEETKIKPTKPYIPAFFGALVAGRHDHQNTRSVETSANCHLFADHPVLSLLLGLPEFTSRVSWNAAVAEFVYTMLIHYLHVGIIKWASTANYFDSPITAIALAKALMLTLMLWAGAASGAHMNPNVTFATVLIGHTTVARGVMYMLMQFPAAMLGIAIARSAYGWDTYNTHALLGGCEKPAGMTDGATVLSNATSFLFILVIIAGTAFDPAQAKLFGPIVGPIAIGLSFALIIVAGNSTVNVAECVGISAVVGETNGDEWISLVGPWSAAVVFAVLFILIPPSHASGEYQAPLLKQLNKLDEEDAVLKQL